MRILLIGKDPEFVVQEPAVMHMPLEVGLNATESEPVANVCPKDSDDHMSKELTKDILRVEFPKDPDLVEVESEKVGLLKNLSTKKLYSIVIIPNADINIILYSARFRDNYRKLLFISFY